MTTEAPLTYLTLGGLFLVEIPILRGFVTSKISPPVSDESLVKFILVVVIFVRALSLYSERVFSFDELFL
jgi:hypothetical protein